MRAGGVGSEVDWRHVVNVSGVMLLPVGEMGVNDEKNCEADFGFVVLRWLQV